MVLRGTELAIMPQIRSLTSILLAALRMTKFIRKGQQLRLYSLVLIFSSPLKVIEVDNC